MAHSSSRPAKNSISNASAKSNVRDGLTAEVPVDVNVPVESESGSAGDEQLFHNQQSLHLAALFVKKWNCLVSQTNWEKGSIIVDGEQADRVGCRGDRLQR